SLQGVCVQAVKLLTIVVPVYNEEGNIEPLYEAVNRTLAQIAERHQWEFVFTDNCSTDRTFETLEQLAGRDSRVRSMGALYEPGTFFPELNEADRAALIRSRTH